MNFFKNVFLYSLLLLLISSKTVIAYNGYDVQVLKSDGITTELQFTLSDYAFIETELTGQDTVFTQIDFDNSVKTSKKGYAELPKIYAAVALPDDSGIVTEILSSEFKDYTINSPLVPSRGVLYRNQDISAIPYEIDPSSVSNEWYPHTIVKTKEPFIFRDIRGLGVYVYPFQYNALNKRIRVHETVTVRITADSSPSNNALTRKSSRITREMNAIYNDLFINYKTIQERQSLTIGEDGDILVLYTKRDSDPVASYAQWKRIKGFNVTTKMVRNETNVKAIVKNAYGANPNLLYVQLVGDWEDIESELSENWAPMDPMLGCVAGLDNYPDLIVGRFSAKTSAEVLTQVKKSINYEKKAGTTGTWYKSALGIGSEEGAGVGDDGEADFEHIDIIKKHRLLKKKYTTVHEIYKTGTPDMVAGYINEGLGLINYTGHGSRTGWGTSGFSNNDITTLSNGDRLPFIISVACVNGSFHGMTGDCFAESWLKKDGGGAVATLMSTINQPWVPPMRGQDYMNDLIIGEYDYTQNPGNGINVTEGRTTIGSIVFYGLILMYTESQNSEDLETLQTWTLFGDAALQLQTNTPLKITVSKTSIESKTPFTTRVTSNNTPQKKLSVTLKQNETIVKGQTDINGSVTINHPFRSGLVILTISGADVETHVYHVTVDGGPGNRPPEIDYKYDIYDLVVTFKNKSYDPDGTIVSYLWDFGDGTTSTEKNPVKTFPKISQYAITLTATDNAGIQSVFKQLIQVGQPAPWPYCSSKGDGSKYEWISQVEINGFSNPSGKEGYGDFTEKIIDITKGVQNSVVLTPEWTTKPYKETFRIWIDLNRDNDFEDEGEKVFEGLLNIDIPGESDFPNSLWGFFTVPTSAVTGKSRMRVSMNYNIYANMCGLLMYGEVEDYTVNLQ